MEDEAREAEVTKAAMRAFVAGVTSWLQSSVLESERSELSEHKCVLETSRVDKRTQLCSSN